MKNKIVTGLLLLSLVMSVSGITTAANAAEKSSSGEQMKDYYTETKAPESLEENPYPDWWDEEDPLNARAYRQSKEHASGQKNRLLAVRDLGFTTQWDGVTYRHCDENIEGKSVAVGIDVSYHQGNIDWEKVKADGIEYAVIRVGYRAYLSGSLARDTKFFDYIEDAKKAGIKVGAYIFSQAISEEEAREEADFAIKQIKESGYELDLPLAIDCEYAAEGVGRLYEANLSKEQMTNVAEAFCERVKSYGYEPMIYSSSSWFYSKMDGERLGKEYRLWMARYNTHSYNADTEAGRELYGGKIDIWQCSSSARVDGISGNVDLDWYYLDPVNGVYKGEDGNWYYYVDGEIDTSYTGIAGNSKGWWRIENGKVNFNYNGFAENENGWWYLKGGQVQFAITDITKGTVNGQTGWWYVKGGQVQLDATTVEKNENGWWYIENGMVDFTHTGIERNDLGWWRIENGQVNFNYNGFAENENGWWYLNGGQVQFNTEDIIKGTVAEEAGWWYINGGQVQLGISTVAKNDLGWWYVKNGKVDFEHYGIEKNSLGWWRIEGGGVNFNFDGFAENANGWWYLEDGAVQFAVTDILKGSVEGNLGWWYVKGGQVSFSDTVAKNSLGWWRIEGGQVNFDFNGFAENTNGWWYLKGGQVDFGKTAVILGNINGVAGQWYVKGGQVQLDYSGEVTVDGKVYEIEDGLVK